MSSLLDSNLLSAVLILAGVLIGHLVTRKRDKALARNDASRVDREDWETVTEGQRQLLVVYKAELDATKSRVSRVEAGREEDKAYIDLLVAHINSGSPPPPPDRPHARHAN